ncbi:SMI1/KNR4 family protein [Cohnella cellulosilytica]|uniref:SMI1/KNR4 family protein n=2 Tax=Cohnella cellulosilytica TaxID=986710 RepID=A0ABW2FGV7_9BACL
MEIQRTLGFIQKCSFSFYKPANQEEIAKFVIETGFTLPSGYLDFLQIHNGALLFQDESGKGNPSWIIFGLDDVTDYHEQYHLTEKMYPIAKYDQTLICVDNQAVIDGREDYLFDRSIYDSPENEGENMHLNFELYLDRLIVSQGDHFWFWNTLNAHNFKSEQ